MNHFSTPSSSRKSSRSSSSTNSKTGLWGWIVAELKHPWYSVKDVDGRVIDIEASFSPSPRFLVIFLKFMMTACVYHVFITDVLGYKNFQYYFIYLTHWTLLACMIYFPLSLVLSLCNFTEQPTDRPGFLVRLTWGLFSTSATLQVIVTLLFWIFEYKTNYIKGMPDYSTFMKHGGIMAFILFEGQIVNKIPVRIKHLQIVEGVGLVYLFWTVLHSQLGIGNLYVDDDGIYPVVNWQSSPETSAIVVAIVTFIVIPILFLMLWGISYIRRRYMSHQSSNSNDYRIQL